MANKTEEAKIRCPFFLRSTQTSISCEGYVKNTCMVTRFPSPEKKAAHEKKFCYLVDGGNCCFAKMLYSKYN